MPRKGDNIYKRKDGRWEGRYIKGRRDDGKAVYGYVYGRTYRATRTALRSADVAASQSAAQTVPDASAIIRRPVPADDTLFQDAALRWLASVRTQVKESSYVRYASLVERCIVPCLGEIPLGALDRPRIEAYCEDLLIHGGRRRTGLSPRTAASALSVVKAILRFAASNGCTVVCDVKEVRVKREIKEMRVLTDREHEKLCRYLCAHPCPADLGILLCLFTGLRIGEICALRWEDISLTERTIHVCRTMQRIENMDPVGARTKIVITEPKSVCSVRTIPIPADVARAIEKLSGHQRGFFLTNSERRFLEPRVMQYRFKKILEECSIAPANFHALRHTFATRCVDLGFDVKSLSVILGHSSVHITMDRYVHPTMNMKKANMDRLTLPFSIK